MKRFFTFLLTVFVATNVVAQEYFYCDNSGIQVYYSYDADTAVVAALCTYGTEYNIIIPSVVTIEGKDYTVTAIGEKAFYDCLKLKSIYLPETITSIGDYAFYDCRDLTSINIPNSVTSIGYSAFDNCSLLTSIDIPNGVSQIKDNTFRRCTELTSVTFPSTVTSIGRSIFYDCPNLTAVTIPENVNFIGFGAFDGCISLTSITIPKNVKSIEGPIFSGCSALSTIKVDSENQYYDSRNNCNAIIETETNTLIAGCQNTIIPEDVSIIGGSAFAYNKNLTAITIPSSVSSISKTAFYGCSALSTIKVEPENPYYDSRNNCNAVIETKTNKLIVGCSSTFIPDNVSSIAEASFWGSGLTAIEIPNCVTSIGNFAFSSCSNLISVTLPNTITSIEDGTFSYCSSLLSIKIPESVMNIGSCSFLECSSLSLIEIPYKVTQISDRAFMDCSNLKSVAISGNNVTLIDWSAFEGSPVTFISCLSVIPPSLYDSISPSPSFETYDATLIVPCESIDAYKKHEIWGKFKKIECRSLSYKTDLPNVTITDGDELPSINLLDYFAKGDNEEFSFIVESSDKQVVYPAVLGEKLEFVQYGTGTTTITVTATVEPISMSRAFTFTINSKPNQPEKTCNLSISSEITNATCNSVANGKIEISVSGGAEPYQYKWTTGRTSSGIYNVRAGSYSVLVVDSLGCTATETFFVSEPSAVAVYEEITNPACGQNNGSISLRVFGGTEPYLYAWEGSTQTTSTIENLSADNYTVTVTDGNSCTAVKSISLSDQSAPTILDPIVTRSKCKDPQGSIQISVSGGAGILKYDWSDSTDVADNLNRPKMYPGIYSLTVTDENNCQATKFVIVPHIPLEQPEIALVSYDDSVKQNIVVWRKELTDDIDHYNIYREINQSGEYEKIGTSAYNDESIYVDKTADFNAFSKRYRISAENNCWESPLSRECKTMLLQWKKKANGSVSLWWDAYEGSEYVKYSIYRLTPKGVEVFAKIPANKISYVIDALPEETIGFYVAIELVHPVYVNEFLKAENGPFIIAISNIAELENRDAVDDITENQVLAFGGDKSIFVNNANGEDVIVCDLTGKTIVRKQNVDSTTIPVQTAGVYIVIVGDRAFKVVVQ